MPPGRNVDGAVIYFIEDGSASFIMRYFSLGMLLFATGSGFALAASASDVRSPKLPALDDPSPNEVERGAALLMLELEERGLAGPGTGVCIDYAGADGPGGRPRFVVGLSTDHFETGVADTKTLDAKKQAELQKGAKNTQEVMGLLEQYLSAGTQNPKSYKVTVYGLADGQSNKMGKYRSKVSGGSELEQSIQANDLLAEERAKNFRNGFLPPGMKSSSTTVALSSPYLETDGGKSTKADCPLRRKVVVDVEFDPHLAEVQGPSGSYVPGFKIADRQLLRKMQIDTASQVLSELLAGGFDIGKKKKIAYSRELDEETKLKIVNGIASSLPQGCNTPETRLYIASIMADYDEAVFKAGFKKIPENDFKTKWAAALANPAWLEDLSRESLTKSFKSNAYIKDANDKDFAGDMINGALGANLSAARKILVADPASKKVKLGGKGTHYQDCFDVSHALKSDFASNPEKIKSYGSSVDKDMDFTISYSDKNVPTLSVSGGRHLHGYGCTACGSGLRFGADGKKAFKDRSGEINGPLHQKLTSDEFLKQNPGKRLSLGSIKDARVYLVPNCPKCQCTDLFERITSGAPDVSTYQINAVPFEEKLKVKAGTCVFTPPVPSACAVSPDGTKEDDGAVQEEKFKWTLANGVAHETKDVADALTFLMKDNSYYSPKPTCGLTGTLPSDPLKESDDLRKLAQKKIDATACSGSNALPTLDKGEGPEKKDCPLK